MKEDDAIHVDAFDLPPSSFLTAQSRAALRLWADRLARALSSCPFDRNNPYKPRHVPAIRQYLEEKLWPALIERYRSQYEVGIEHVAVSGVGADVITPAEGIPHRNQDRVLINLHSGGFVIGARYGGQVESIAVAALGKIRVISLDYRMAPEHEYPTATDDVVDVYRDLLSQYEASKIGIYGCSAGALLTAQTVARLQQEGLPVPGAVGMFCGAGAYWTEGDSGHFEAALGHHAFATSRQHPYFEHADPLNAMAFPLRSAALLANFPPSLLIASTRDQALSSVVHMHSRLVALGRVAQLHVWEGLGHAFFYEPELPETLEMFNVTVRFFDKHLAA